MNKNSNAKLLTALSALGGSAATSMGMDAIMHPDEKFLGGDWSKTRIGNFTLNALLGAGGGVKAHQGDLVNAAKLIAMAPAKDVALAATGTIGKVNQTLDATNTTLKNLPTQVESNSKWMKALGAGALGLGGIALIAGLLRKNKKKQESKGTIKYTITGKKDDPSDDIEVELPVDTAKLSPVMLQHMDANIRRQAQRNIKANMRKRDPETGKLISLDEYAKKYGRTKSAAAEFIGQNTTPFFTLGDDYATTTTEAFYRLQAGLGLNENTGSSVKAASRAFHEGAGTALTSIASAGAGALLGQKLTQGNPLLGLLAGGALGGLTPILAGKALAGLQEEDRSTETQEKHDDGAALAEYLIPGYGSYQHSRRKGVKTTQLEGTSFAATGMNPLQESYGTSLDDFAEADMQAEEDYDALSKYASAPPPPPSKPANPQTTAPIQNDQRHQTATRAGSQIGSIKNVLDKMNNIFVKIKARSQFMTQPPTQAPAPQQGPPPPPPAPAPAPAPQPAPAQ